MVIEKRSNVRYNPKESIILANKIIEQCRYKLSPHGFILLMGLCQSINFQEELFPDIEIEIKGLFKFFHLKETNNKRYDIVRDALFNITNNPLHYKINERRWGSIPWLSAEFDEKKKTRVVICFHPKIIPYLLAFKEANKKVANYTKLFPTNYTRLRNNMAVWLYPFFRKWCPKEEGQVAIVVRKIEWLREKTYAEKDLQIISHFIQAINRAIENICKKSDIEIVKLAQSNDTLISGADNRTTESVKFLISLKPKKKKASDVKQKKKTHKQVLEELSLTYRVVEEMPFELKEELYYTKGFDKYAEDNDCVITRIGEKYYKCLY